MTACVNFSEPQNLPTVFQYTHPDPIFLKKQEAPKARASLNQNNIVYSFSFW